MNKIINWVSLSALFFAGIYSCTGNYTQKNKPVTHQQIIKGVLKSATGEEMQYSFDNTANTMTIQYKGETTTLTGQRTGSGIKYANEKYIYSEWQGNYNLYKDGVKIFEAHSESAKQK